MTDVRFYRADADGGRTVIGLLREALADRTRVLLHVETDDHAAQVSDWLWKQDGFLSHGTSRDLHGDIQPVYVSPALDAPNCARRLMLMDDAQVDMESVGGFEQVDVVVGANNRGIARGLWKAALTAGLEPRLMKRQDYGCWAEAARGSKERKGDAD